MKLPILAVSGGFRATVAPFLIQWSNKWPQNLPEKQPEKRPNSIELPPRSSFLKRLPSLFISSASKLTDSMDWRLVSLPMSSAASAEVIRDFPGQAKSEVTSGSLADRGGGKLIFDKRASVVDVLHSCSAELLLP